MSQELLDQFRADGSRLPAGFRVGEVTGHPVRQGGEPPSFRSCYVQAEDEHARVELEGQLVSPVFRDEHDDDGRWVRTVIVKRRIENRATAGYVKAARADG
jgi:hypothetical protein